MSRQKITTFLWFDDQAEEAANFYVSLFPDSRVLGVTRYSEAGPGPAGQAMIVEFQLAGIQYLALNGGPIFEFTEAISLSVDCQSQAEIDLLWDKLSEGGSKGQCGWLKDSFGLSWQIVPSVLPKLMSNPTRAGKVMQALMQMTKLDIAKLQAAYESP
jgi:predicted 3-demethylubiquinone-9 3-methyltransferase (glyoxalase superfamily)